MMTSQGTAITKRCPRCGETSIAAFARNSRRPSGLQDYCKLCMKAAVTASKGKKPDEYAERARERARQRYIENPEVMRARSSRYRMTNAERVKNAKRARYQAHREQNLAYARKYRSEHASDLRLRNQLNREANREQIRARDRQLYRTRRSVYLRKRHAVRARQAGAYEHYTAAQWDALVAFYCPDGRCLRCNEVRQITVDHVVPLSLGGPNTIGNIQCLCLTCNSSKSQQSADYRPDQGWYAQRLEQEGI